MKKRRTHYVSVGLLSPRMPLVHPVLCNLSILAALDLYTPHIHTSSDAAARTEYRAFLKGQHHALHRDTAEKAVGVFSIAHEHRRVHLLTSVEMAFQ